MREFHESDPLSPLQRKLRESANRNGRRKERRAREEPALLEECVPFVMATTAWSDMMSDLTTRPAEAGGILIGPIGHDAVTHYVPDLTGSATGASFTFDHVRLNERLRRYVPLGLDAKGVAHSHPRGCLTPSLGDIDFVRDCFHVAPPEFEQFYLPIVVGKRLLPYVVVRGEPLATVYAQLILF